MISKGGNLMFNKKLPFNFNEHFRKNFWLYVISLLFTCIGIVIGIYTVKYMGSFQKSDLKSYIQSFSSSVASGKIQNKILFIETIKNNIPIIALIWFLGLTIIGIPIVLIIDIIKGFTLGFSAGFLINSLGIKGAWVCLLGILPQNIIYIPCLIIASVFAMEFSLALIKDNKNKNWISNIWMRIATYSFSFLFLILFMCLGFILESYLSPNLIKLVVTSYWSVTA